MSILLFILIFSASTSKANINSSSRKSSEENEVVYQAYMASLPASLTGLVDHANVSSNSVLSNKQTVLEYGISRQNQAPTSHQLVLRQVADENSTTIHFFPQIIKKYLPHLHDIHLPRTSDELLSIFGAHLKWAAVLLVFGFATWSYVRYVRPRIKNSIMDDAIEQHGNLSLLDGEKVLFCGDSEEVGFETL